MSAPPPSPLSRATSDFLSADIDGSPKSPDRPVGGSTHEWKAAMYAQIGAVYRLSEGPTPVVFANTKCYDLSFEFISRFSDDVQVNVHQRRQMEIALTLLEQAKDAVAKAYMLGNK